MQQLVKARYQIRIKPNKEQYNKILQFAGCSRFVYNHLLKINKNRYSNSLKGLNTREMEAEIKKLKSEYGWLTDCLAAVLQQSRIDLQKAFSNFFKGLNGTYNQKYGYPSYKSRHNKISFRMTCNNGRADVVGSKLKLPKIGLVPIKSRHLPEYEKLTSVTIIVEPSGKVYASLAVEKFVDNKVKTGKSTGIDLGLESFITLSNGQKIPPFNFAKNELDKTVSMDIKLSKMRTKLKKAGTIHKDASNYQKYKQKVAKYKAHIANQRKDALHKLTTQLVTNYDCIIVEDLNIKGMTKKSRLAYAIQDASWSMFVAMLEYKCAWYGKVFHKIGRFEPTSTVCSECDTYHKDIVNSLAVRNWTCPDCGVTHDRDINAAKNILKIGIQDLNRK